MKIVALLLFIVKAISLIESRYINEEASNTSNQFPYVVSIQNRDKDHICGGTIIRKDLILTAAHCLEGIQRRDIRIVAGTQNLSKPGIRNRVAKIVRADYNDEEFSHDIALLKLFQELPITANIQPIPLATSEPPFGVSLTTCGWGMRYFWDLEPSDELQTTEVTAISLEQCREEFSVFSEVKEITKQNICTLSLSGKGLCIGDSGGPLEYEGKLVGIVSYGGIPCGKGYPNVFTKVSEYYRWIQEAIELIDQK